jgi:hypothetical protein
VGAIVVPRTVGPRRVGVSTPAIGQSHFGDVEDLVDTDVTFLGLGHGWNDYAAMAVDQSSVRDDFDTVVAKTHMSTINPDPSPRRRFDNSEFEILIRLATPTTPATVRYVRRTFGGGSPSIQWTGGDFVFLWNGGALSSLSFLDIPLTAEPRELLLAWSIRDNPDTTGPSDALLSIVRLWDFEGGTYDENTQTHVASTSDATSIIVGSDLTTPFVGDATAQAAIRYVRISKRARTRDELEALLPLVRQWPAPEPLASLGDGLIFRPNMYSLVDPVSGDVGANIGTLYDADTDARNFDTDTDELRFNPGQSADLTFACWINISAVGVTQRLCQLRGSSTSDPVIYLTSAERLALFWFHSTTALSVIVSSLTPVRSSEWTHVTWTTTGPLAADAVAYMQGVPVAKTTEIDGVGTRGDNNGLWILGNTQGGDTALRGLMADVRVWNRVLTPAEVYNLWQSSRTF